MVRSKAKPYYVQRSMAFVLVPLLTGLDSNVALFAAGVATLIFQALTRGTVPVFLASSFAFIAPIIYGVKTWGIPQTLCGLTAAGLVYMALSALIRIKGSGIVERILPPIVTGPVIMVIGLILSGRKAEKKHRNRVFFKISLEKRVSCICRNIEENGMWSMAYGCAPHCLFAQKKA